MLNAFLDVFVVFFKHGFGEEPVLGFCFFVVCVVLRSSGVEVSGLNAGTPVAQVCDDLVVGD